MFHNISETMQARMREMELQDAIDRTDGTPLLQRLRQIPVVTGKFLALLCASSPQGTVLEIGTSAGYSTLWLALACEHRGIELNTFEILPEKVVRAQETFKIAGIEQTVNLIHGDARQHADKFRGIAFCFLDAEKDIYSDIYDQVIPNLVPGGILAADNIISHATELANFVAHAEQDRRVDALVVPIGKGVLICRRV